jgi:oligogalacturonide transport system substrate-binding protein
LLTADIDVINKLILQPYVAQLTGKNWINDDYTTGFDRDNLIKGLTYLSDLYKNGVMEPFGDSSAFVGKMEQNPKWIKGQIGMLFDYISAYDKYKQSVPGGKLGVAAYPQAPNALQSGNPIAAGTGFAVSKDSANKEEAIKFINWMVNDKDAAVILGTQRGIPATSSGQKALQDAKQLDPNISKGLEFAGKPKTIAPNVISTNADLAQIVKDSLQKLIYQKETPEQAADEIIKSCGAKLAALKK